MPNNPLQSIVEQYTAQRPQYEELGRYLEHMLTGLTTRLGMHPIIMSRAKAVDSFAEKIFRPGKQFNDPLVDMTDLCGVRVITHTLDEVAVLAGMVKDIFLVDALNSEDKAEQLALKEFGYLSTHFIIQLQEVPPDKPYLGGLKAELQIRTMAQHLWADSYHALGYKNEFHLPRRWEREFARLAALLENCDQSLQEMKDAMRTYESNYGAYIAPAQLSELAERLEALLCVTPENLKMQHRLIRVYLALGEHEKIIALLERSGTALHSYPPALRDIGVAHCQAFRKATDSQDFQKGLDLLHSAIAADPNDVDARCSLGGALRRQGKLDEAVVCYREAHRLDPTNPYPLGNFIGLELLRKRDADLVHYFGAAIQGAIERCQKQVEVQINFPWAFFDLGTFYLYLGDVYASVNWYAKGVESSPHSWMIESAHAPIKGLIEHSVQLEGLDFLDRILKLGWWVRATEEERLASTWRPTPAPEGITFSGSTLVLSGGCGGLESAFQPQMEQLQAGLERALAPVSSSTLVSGGTHSGISALGGNLQEAVGSRLTTIGYLPRKPIDQGKEQADSRYKFLQYTEGGDFSPLEILTFWEHFLAGDGDPASVRVIGFNGGRISAFEYRLALALGAKMGIVINSGRAADELLADPMWNTHPSLHRIDLSQIGPDGSLPDFLQFWTSRHQSPSPDS